MTSALQGTIQKITTMADGSVRLIVDVFDTSLGTVAELTPPHQVVGIAPLRATPGQDAPAPDYGDFAKALRLSSFFRTPAVWDAVGTDKQFLDWIKERDRSATGRPARDDDQVVPAHVRRVGSGAGTGIKPPFSAIPLLNSEHQRQHQHGESVIGPPEWWDKARINTVQAWAWEQLKQSLGFESWREVPPRVLLEWAQDRELVQYLPQEYREC